jgi:HAMP domain-containing protein
MNTLAIIAFAVLMVVLVAAAFLIGLNYENARQRKERHDLKSEVAALRMMLEMERRRKG